MMIMHLATKILFTLGFLLSNYIIIRSIIKAKPNGKY